MTATTVVLVITGDVTRKKPSDELTQGVFIQRFYHKVKVIRHQTECEIFTGRRSLVSARMERKASQSWALWKTDGAAVPAINKVAGISIPLARDILGVFAIFIMVLLGTANNKN